MFSKCRKILPAFALLTLVGCTATGEKDYAAPATPVHTLEQLTSDTQELHDRTEILERIGLSFEMKKVDGKKVAAWKENTTTAPVSIALQITELDRFVETAKKFAAQYTTYVSEGKSRALPQSSVETLNAEIELAEATLKQLQGK
jgi:hypothetical protein